MDVNEVLLDAFGRVDEHVRTVLDGLDAGLLVESPADGANPIGWLLWHLTRVEDDHVADLLGTDQVWIGDGWAGRFGLEPDPHNNGYDHTPDEVAAVRPDGPDAIAGYREAVAERTRAYLRDIGTDELDRVVDESFDPPVTVGVRLISVADDAIQHAGQAAYARGLLERA